jgi:hypothetical protein
MNKVVRTIRLLFALLVASTIVLIAMPMVAFLSLVHLTRIMISIAGGGRLLRPADKFEATSQTPHQHRPLTIETSYQWLDQESRR